MDIIKIPTEASYRLVCKCDCGNVKNYRLCHLTNKDEKNRTVSCGCYGKERSSIVHSNMAPWYKRNGNKYYFIDDTGKMIKCRSSYEVLFANWMNKNNMRYVYEPKIFKIDSARRYKPDFYLPDEKVFVDLKGWNYNESQKNNIATLINSGEKIKVMKYDEMYNVCGLKYTHSSRYKTVAEKFGMKVEDYLAMGHY